MNLDTTSLDSANGGAAEALPLLGAGEVGVANVVAGGVTMSALVRCDPPGPTFATRSDPPINTAAAAVPMARIARVERRRRGGGGRPTEVGGAGGNWLIAGEPVSSEATGDGVGAVTGTGPDGGAG
jgi:hypothetical protein